ncbi:MAG: carbohydrate binding domain-containing protein [Candidatus Sumerlaeota bacterium]|nr:carbohydrate binding domain-containing protein [Candidatus Sumerlaeota bacterium]
MGRSRRALKIFAMTALAAIAQWGCDSASAQAESAAITQKAATSSPAVLFPFVLPWDDSTSSVANLSSWLPKPAGKFGSIRAGSDGRLYAGRERIRLFGVDLAFSANFPLKEDAEKIAARMAKFGINIVRFHIMDMSRFPNGLLAHNASDTRQFDPEALERLDYFTSQLKQNGIYVYLCLLNYRPFNAADGLPKEIEQMGDPYQGRHVPGFYDARMLDLQKEYARNLLTHRNSHTGLTYTEDPAVAFVEINNENGLIHSWLGGTIDRLPEAFLPELRRQWNEWLRRRHGATGKLRQAWGVEEEAFGKELIANADFSSGMESWYLELHEKAEATAAPDGDVPEPLRGAKSVCVTVTKPSAERWHIRFQQGRLSLQGAKPYTLSFWAKAQKPCAIGVSMEQNHEPWRNLGLRNEAALTAQWKQFHFVFTNEQGNDEARAVFDPASQPGVFWLAGVSLRSGGIRGLGANERAEDGNVPLFLRTQAGERSAEAQRDWLRFLWETEDRYWQAMRNYLKDNLKAKALVIGTSAACSTPNMMARMDCVDAHAYWQHPIFPGRPWDSENWIVRNRTMVNDPGGVLPDLALRRVAGRPFCVTEYGHCAPSTYVSEGNLLRAAYAALQDWDYISASRYAQKSDWDIRRIRGFFDMDQHPTKMLTMIPAAAMFLRADVKPAQELAAAAIDKEREVEILRRAQAWDMAHAGNAGMAREATLIHRTAVVVEGQTSPPGALRPEQVKIAGEKFVSDTGELVWDLSRKERGVVTLNAPRSKAVIGFGGGLRFDLGGVIVEPGPTLQNGWSAITVTQMDGGSAMDSGSAAATSEPSRWLITATGYIENTNMGWKNAEKNSVGKDWGQAPTLVEGVPARVTLPVPAARAKAWTLDERGVRKTPLAVRPDERGNAVAAFGPEQKTLWYEVSANGE